MLLGTLLRVAALAKSAAPPPLTRALATNVNGSAAVPKELRALAARLGHDFADPAHLERAITHPSSGLAAASSRFERLEFLGDRVLGLVVAEWLEDVFPGEDEGDAQHRLADLVQARALVYVGREVLGVAGVVRTQARSAAAAAKVSDRGVVGDAVEALIGAVFLDAGYEAARRAVLKAWAPLLERARKAPVPLASAKNRLQEAAQRGGRPDPTYEVLKRDGPAHDPAFTMKCSYAPTPDDVRAAVASARGKHPKRRAEALAAQALLDQLELDAAAECTPSPQPPPQRRVTLPPSESDPSRSSSGTGNVVRATKQLARTPGL